MKDKPGNIVPSLFTALLFAGSFIAGKYTTIDLGPLTTSLLRYVIAILFLLVMAVSGRRSALRVQRTDLIWFILLGLFGVVGYHYFFFSALRYTEVANTAIIHAMNPIVTGLMAAVFIRERLSVRNYLGIVLAVAGVITLITKADLKKPHRPQGQYRRYPHALRGRQLGFLCHHRQKNGPKAFPDSP